MERFLPLSFAVALVACDPAPVVPSCSSTEDCPTGQSCVDGRCVEGMDAGDTGSDGGPVVTPDAHRPGLSAIAITPADPVLSTTNGTPSSVDLEVLARYDDGSEVAVPTGFWTVDSTLLGAIDATTGVFTATGELAGTTTVRVEALGQTASTTITVEVAHVIVADGAPSDAAGRFGGTPVTDAARAAGLLYPLDGVVFPENVFPADVQWERGAEGDLFRVSMTARGVDVTAYVAHTGAGFGFHWPVTRPAWRALAESAPETPVTLRVDRWEMASGEVIGGAPRTLRFADAVIRGAIYYWDLGGGRIQRIRGDGTGLEAFMPSPPPRPSDGQRCVACHTVSRDGRRMAAELWDGGDFGTVFDLTVDLSTDPAPTVFPTDRTRFLSASFNPDASRLIANYQNELFLLDANTGTRLTPAGTPLPTTNAAHPTWSPDGNSIAFVTNTDGSWGVDFTRGDLALIDVTAPDTFSAQRTILFGGSLVVARPSWSPDSAWIAFQHGGHSRAFEDPGAAASIRRDATIRMASRDGATVFDLEALNAGAANSYYPTFSPFDEGGYYWLAFFSTRDYGNAQVGTRGTERRQLWVTAVSSSPTPGVDPSHAPYWLPQQDVSAQNMAAFWAQEPCLADGRTCAASGECCSGFCRDTGAGPICVPPDDVPCSMEGEACGDDGDCCDGAGTCVGNVCSRLM